MPVFSDAQITPSEKLAIISFLENVNKKGYNEGGHPIGRIGPVAEGLVAWIVGIGACVVFTLWIGSRIS
jgi:ubiquinol-cytochrome c reductase cytochrome c subunit